MADENVFPAHIDPESDWARLLRNYFTNPVTEPFDIVFTHADLSMSVSATYPLTGSSEQLTPKRNEAGNEVDGGE